MDYWAGRAGQLRVFYVKAQPPNCPTKTVVGGSGLDPLLRLFEKITYRLMGVGPTLPSPIKTPHR